MCLSVCVCEDMYANVEDDEDEDEDDDDDDDDDDDVWQALAEKKTACPVSRDQMGHDTVPTGFAGAKGGVLEVPLRVLWK